MRKKIGCVVLMMIVSMVMLASTALAASFNVTIEPNKNFNDVAVNGEIIYTISTSAKSNNFNFDVIYNHSQLEYVGCLTEGVSANIVDSNVRCIHTSIGGAGLNEVKLKFKKLANSTSNVEIDLDEYLFTLVGSEDSLPGSEISVTFQDAVQTQTGDTNQGTEAGDTNQGTQTGDTNQGTQTGDTNQGTQTGDTNQGTQTGDTNQGTTGTQNNNTQQTTGTKEETKTETKEEKATEQKNDASQSNKVLPQTGSSNVLVLATTVGMAIVVGAGIAMKKNF